MSIRSALAAASLAAITAFGAQAQTPGRYEFDKSHTHIIFMVEHLGYSWTIGRFRDFDGYFTFDEKDPAKSEVRVTLKPASVDTSVPALDKELLGEKFFNVAKFPTMEFKSTGIAVTGAKTGSVAGDFTMLGVTRPVKLDVTYNKSGVHPYTSDYVSGFSIRTQLKRSDFGMNAYLPDVGDQVNAIIEVEGIDHSRKPGKIEK